MERGEEMKFLVVTLLVIGMLITLGLARNTEATNNSLEDRVLALEDTVDLFYEEFSVHEEHILVLEDKVAALEDAIDQQPEEADDGTGQETDSELSEEQAVGLVQQALASSLSGSSNGCWSLPNLEIIPCFLADPVLTGWHDAIAGLPNWMLESYLEVVHRDMITTQAQWAGIYDAEQGRWRVQAVSTMDPGVIYPFYLDETTGLVVGDYAVTE
jgi:hypothetical protein